MIVLQNRIIAKTIGEAAELIRGKHKNMKGSPHISLQMRIGDTNYYEYTVEIERGAGSRMNDIDLLRVLRDYHPDFYKKIEDELCIDKFIESPIPAKDCNDDCKACYQRILNG